MPSSAPETSPSESAGAEACSSTGEAVIQPTRLQRLGAYRILFAIAVAVLLLDQFTKWLVTANLPYPTYGEPGAVRIIRGFLYFVHVGNTGAAWSMFTGQGVLLAGLAAATLIAIAIWRHALGLRDRVAQLCFGLLCGGIAGNLIDRLRHGHVVDFIDVHFGTYVYPTFNVADSGICIGVIIYLWHSLRETK